MLDEHKLRVKRKAQCGALLTWARSLRNQAVTPTPNRNPNRNPNLKPSGEAAAHVYMYIAQWREAAWEANHQNELARALQREAERRHAAVSELEGEGRKKDQKRVLSLMEKTMKSWGISSLALLLSAWRVNTHDALYAAEKAKAANFQSYSEEQRQKLIRLANATNIQLEHVLSVYDTDGAALFCLLC